MLKLSLDMFPSFVRTRSPRKGKGKTLTQPSLGHCLQLPVVGHRHRFYETLPLSSLGYPGHGIQ